MSLPAAKASKAQIIDGKAVAASVTDVVGREAHRITEKSGVTPGLAVVLVGNDPASEVYVRNKGRTAEKLGFHSRQHTLPVETTEAELLAIVEKLNADATIHGILVQLPLPSAISSTRVLEAIKPEKDVDGFHPINVGRLTSGLMESALVPCTPAGCLILLEQVLGKDFSGKSAVVVGRSTIVGRPVASLLLHRNATVTIAHSRTADLPGLLSTADIVIAAIGRPEMIRGAWLKPGATVIDVGINRIPLPENPEGKKSRLVGDVAFDEAVENAGAITPVPGGVGPMTIAMLMANTLTAACRQNGLPEPDLSLGN